MSDNEKESAFVFAHVNAMRDEVTELAKSKGWHDPVPPPMAKQTANIHGEVSELWEAYRRHTLNDPCDKAEEMEAVGLPALTCAEEEVADIIIRTLHTAGILGIDVGRALRVKHAFNKTRPYRHGGKKA